MTFATALIPFRDDGVQGSDRQRCPAKHFHHIATELPVVALVAVSEFAVWHFFRSIAVQFASFPETTVFDIFTTLWRYRKRLAATALAIFGATLAYALLAPPIWQGSQAMIVHNALETSLGSGPRMSGEDQAKNTQQTLREMACSSSLLACALKRVSSPDRADLSAAWPSAKAVEDLRGEVSLVPPKGIELGKSEVLYLKVKNPQRERALRLTEAVYAELERAFGELQATVARSRNRPTDRSG